MANKTTVALSREDYDRIIEAIDNGFTYSENGTTKKFRANNRLSIVLQLEATLGMRIGDILNLKNSGIIKDGNRYRLDIIEQKTGKKREFEVEKEVYLFLKEYAMMNGISDNEYLFDVKERVIQKNLKIVADYLGIKNVSTHSFRKSFASKMYEDSGYNIELVRALLQHATTKTTQRYIKCSEKQIKTALKTATDTFWKR